MSTETFYVWQERIWSFIQKKYVWNYKAQLIVETDPPNVLEDSPAYREFNLFINQYICSFEGSMYGAHNGHPKTESGRKLEDEEFETIESILLCTAD